MVALQFVLPDAPDGEALPPQQAAALRISSNIALQLWDPVIGIVFGEPSMFRARVPETAVKKNCDVKPRE